MYKSQQVVFLSNKETFLYVARVYYVIIQFGFKADKVKIWKFVEQSFVIDVRRIWGYHLL